MVKMNKAFKYKMLPNSNQKELLNNHFYSYNQAWNIALSYHIKNRNNNNLIKELIPEYKSCNISNTDLDKEIKNILYKRNLFFNTKVVQQSRTNCTTAISSNYKSYSTKKKNNSTTKYGDVSYRSSKDSSQMIEMTKEQYKIINTNNLKKGVLRLFREDFVYIKHREIPENYNITNVKILKEDNDYYIVFNVNYEIISPDKTVDNRIGMDFNIKDLDLGNSTIHKKFSNSDFLNLKNERLNNTIRILQRKQSRRQLNKNYNKNYYKTKSKLKKLHRKVLNKRNDLLHKRANEILVFIKSIGLNHLVVEKLDVKNMTSKSNSVNGLSKKASKTMRKNILTISPSMLYEVLKWKCVQFGIHFSQVDPKYTSKSCSKCGSINKELMLEHRVFECKECNNTLDRDLNACLNILARAKSFK